MPCSETVCKKLRSVKMSAEILRPLTEDEVIELLGIYREKYGDENFHYLLMYNQHKWNQQVPPPPDSECVERDTWLPFRKAFYTHRSGDFRQYGTYVSLHFDVMQSVSFHSWQPDGSELFQCLRETQLIDWSASPLLTNVDLENCERVKALAVSKGVSVERARRCCGLLLPHDRALQLQVPSLAEGLELRPLQLAHAEIVHALWTNKKEGSLDYIRKLIEINKTLGIYRSSDDMLIAWVFQNDFAGLGILQVDPEVQRRGYGSLLAAALSLRIAQTEPVHPTAWIIVENFKSEGLLEKVGFVKTLYNEWIQLRKH